MGLGTHWAMGNAEVRWHQDQAKIRHWVQSRYVKPPYKRPLPRPPAWVSIDIIDGQVTISEQRREV